MRLIRSKYFALIIIILVALILGYLYDIGNIFATIIGLVGLVFGWILFKLADINLKIFLYLVIEVCILILAFSIAYYEIIKDYLNALTISTQVLFHFTIINTPDELANNTAFKILALFEGFIGYFLLVTGVVMLISKNKLKFSK